MASKPARYQYRYCPAVRVATQDAGMYAWQPGGGNRSASQSWPHPAPMVRTLGAGWMDATQVQPREDTGSCLCYVVYSPAYMGTLQLCSFQLFSTARWWHEGLQVSVSGVIHWRLADGVNEDFVELDGPPVALQVAGHFHSAQAVVQQHGQNGAVSNISNNRFRVRRTGRIRLYSAECPPCGVVHHPMLPSPGRPQTRGSLCC